MRNLDNSFSSVTLRDVQLNAIYYLGLHKAAGLVMQRRSLLEAYILWEDEHHHTRTGM